MGSDPTRTRTKGYLHPAYAASLSEFGTPRLLPASGGWVLEREIPGTGLRDAMGCYPLFCCDNWAALADDLSTIKEEMVSLSLVADPLGKYSRAELELAFRDVVRPFKEHLVVDLENDAWRSVSKHHRYYARRALQELSVETCSEPDTRFEEWVVLYDEVIARHGLQGIKAFSRSSFARQLEVPGLVMLRAIHAGECVGAHLWYVAGEAAYSHLQAVTPAGYRSMAAYALYGAALEWFAGRVRWLNLGGGAGSSVGDVTDGLTQFKRGWSTETRTAYFCGRIFNPEHYAALTRAADLPPDGHFPAYRAGEFR